MERLKTGDHSTGGIKGFKKPFTESEVRDMRLLNERGLSLISIGMIYGVRHATIRVNLDPEVRARQYEAVKEKKPTLTDASKERRRAKERERGRIRKETDRAYVKRRKELADIQSAKRKEKKALEAPKVVKEKKPKDPLKKASRYADASFSADFIEAMQTKSLEGASFEEILGMDSRLEGVSAHTINRLLNPVFLRQIKTGAKSEKEKTTHGKAKGVKFIPSEIEDMRLLNRRCLSFGFLGKIYGVGHESIRRHVDEDAREKSRMLGNNRYERIKEDSEALAKLRKSERERDADRRSIDPKYAEEKAQQLRDLRKKKKRPQSADV